MYMYTGMSIDFEVAGENWKVAGKLMQTTQPSAAPSLLVALYGQESGGHWRRPFFTTGTFDYIVAVIQALQFVDYKDVLRFYFFNAQLTNYKCSLIQYGDENYFEVLVACLIRVLLYRRNVYNFVKRHSELIAIFLKKNRKNREYVTRIIQSLRLRFHLWWAENNDWYYSG